MRPASRWRLPTRGSNPHIEDIARRLALDGFMAFAPDALTPLGGYPGDEDKAREGFAKLDQAHALNDFLAAAAWLKARPKAPLLVQRADIDERINAAWPACEAALRAAGVRFTDHRYPGTQHGFNNDTTPRYDAAAAQLAWSRTVAFFKAQLAVAG